MTTTSSMTPARHAPAHGKYRSAGPADRFMRWLLRVPQVRAQAGRGAHRAFRTAVFVTAIRCLITYLAVPILIPILSLTGWIAAPIGTSLCLLAVVNGVVAVRRFWQADHRFRWLYTGFMAVVFLILTVALYTEINRLMVIL